jgi:hypothetical protein
VLFLAKNGVPWDVANDLDEVERAAFVVILAEFEGGRFDWNTGQWRKR